MRLLSLVVTVMIIGALLYKQLATEPPQDESDVDATSLGVPKIPTKPNQLQGFEKDMNDFMSEQSKETARRIKEAEGE